MKRLAILLGFFLFSVSLYAEEPFQWKNCGGKAGSSRCEMVLYFSECKTRFELNWPNLALPGKSDWHKGRNNWCSLAWKVGDKLVAERKSPKERCFSNF